MPDRNYPTSSSTNQIYEKLANILPRPQKNSAIRLYNDVLPQQRPLIETLLHTPLTAPYGHTIGSGRTADALVGHSRHCLRH